MLYDIFIEPFKCGEWFWGCVTWIVAILAVIIIFLILGLAVEEYQWSRTPVFEWECTLLDSYHKSSTSQTSAVPVVNISGGIGVGMVSSGESEKFVCVWDCGKYGRNVSDDEEIFRFAKEKSTLYLKEKGDSIRIVGIKRIVK